MALFPTLVSSQVPPDTVSGSCVSAACHSTLITKKFVHEPASDGDSCDICHESVEPGRHNFKLSTEGGELCLDCHEVIESDHEVTHGPVSEGRCVDCHDPHASDHAAQLKAEIPDLCFSCHDRVVIDDDGVRMPSLFASYNDSDLFLHAPFEAGECMMCHTPHSSANYRLLTDPLPKSMYASFSEDKYLCLSCHDGEAFTEVRTTRATEFRNGTLNLHFRHVNKPKGRTCRACHEHHASRREALIRDKPPAGHAFINIGAFERTENGGSCAPTCHRGLSYDRLTAIEHGLKVTPLPPADAANVPEELNQ